MVLKAYVLIVADPGKTKQVYDEIQKIEAIAEVHEVMGPYDIVVELNVESLQEIPPLLSDRIRPLPGILSTTSLVTFPE
jgi:DNA-binding Lrp family transcriptional regulator